MKRMLIMGMAIVAAIIASVLVLVPSRARAASAHVGNPIGATCTIQFRRDALGTASSSPVPPLTGNFNGADTCVSGKLESMNDDWLVVEHSGHELWIPKAAVLLFEVNR